MAGYLLDRSCILAVLSCALGKHCSMSYLISLGPVGQAFIGEIPNLLFTTVIMPALLLMIKYYHLASHITESYNFYCH